MSERMAPVLVMVLTVICSCTHVGHGPAGIFESNPCSPNESYCIRPDITFDSCRCNIDALSSAEFTYYGMYDRFTGDIDQLYGIVGDTLLCPWTGEPYEITLLGDDGFQVLCSGYPDHPAFFFGQDAPASVGGCGECRQNMRLIASAEAMYFAAFERYGTIEDLLAEGLIPGMTCPGCGSGYIIDPGWQTYELSCPMPCYPSHGSVVDGIVSWQ